MSLCHVEALLWTFQLQDAAGKLRHACFPEDDDTNGIAK